MIPQFLRFVLLVPATVCLLLSTSASAADPDVAQSLQALEQSAGGSLRSVVSPHTGAVTFLRASGPGIPLGSNAAAPAAERARAFLRAHGRSLKLPDADETVVAASSGPDEAGFEHVRLRQQ